MGAAGERLGARRPVDGGTGKIEGACDGPRRGERGREPEPEFAPKKNVRRERRGDSASEAASRGDGGDCGGRGNCRGGVGWIDEESGAAGDAMTMLNKKRRR